MSKTERAALVTGSAAGFGLLTSIELARKGFTVWATMRDAARREKLDAAAREAKVTERIVVERLDVTSVESLAAVAEKLHARHGALEVLVNNAGYGLGGFVEDVAEEELRAQFETNFFGLVRTTKAFLPKMREAGRGTVIQVSSIAGRVGMPGVSSYAASKWAVEGWSESLRYEVAPFGVRVVLVEPGQFRTDIFERNAKLAAKATDPSSFWFERSKRVIEDTQRQVASSKADPIAVARLIAKIATMRAPKLRYTVGKDAFAGAFFRGVLPRSAFERIVQWKFDGITKG